LTSKIRTIPMARRAVWAILDLSLLSERTVMVEVGQPAPDFELPDQNGEPVRLSELRGQRVVVYFYPKADTPGY